MLAVKRAIRVCGCGFLDFPHSIVRSSTIHTLYTISPLSICDNLESIEASTV
jgi:hypothetical protein